MLKTLKNFEYSLESVEIGLCALASHLDSEVRQFETKKISCRFSLADVDIFREK